MLQRLRIIRSQPLGKSRGFTLIEVLISLLILLVGLLGVAGVQLLSLKQVNNANLRSQVNGHAVQMVEMIRANDGNALSAGDVTNWTNALTRDVPGAAANVAFTGGGSSVDVTITWQERVYGTDAENQTFTLTSRLER